MMPALEALVDVTRGALVESAHRGAAAIVDADGKLLYSIGDPYLVTYPRSSAKPFQALPLLESGAADHFHFSEREIAIACASHAAEDFHVETVSGILARLGLDESALMCGIHPPANKAAADALRAAGLKPTTLHSNCSGKHSGMLALATFMGVPTEGYYRPAHPVQQRILEVVSDFCGLAEGEIVLASDGCTVPTFGMPLYSFAWGLARFVDARSWPESRQAACRRIVQAMQRHPEMVAGTARLDTDLMRVAGGSLISKGGAEGYHAVGVLPGGVFGKGVGVALKVMDGDVTGRARPPAVIEILRQLGVLGDEQVGALSSYHHAPVNNMRGSVVGEVRPALTLRRTR